MLAEELFSMANQGSHYLIMIIWAEERYRCISTESYPGSFRAF